jgi:RNA polymerase sigma factor (sigma-70 family)
MGDDDPVTQWLADLKSDERAAAELLWQRYWRRVAGLARRFLFAGHASGAEDVAQSVFLSFFVRVRDGRFPRLEDRQDLWKLLATITIRKALRQKRRQARQPAAVEEIDSISRELARAPRHEVVAVLKDEVERLLRLLDEGSQRVVGCLLEGQTNQETAKACGVSVSTVERKRKLIRETWLRQMPP